MICNDLLNSFFMCNCMTDMLFICCCYLMCIVSSKRDTNHTAPCCHLMRIAFFAVFVAAVERGRGGRGGPSSCLYSRHAVDMLLFYVYCISSPHN